jgi:hypothetical protein
MNENAREPGKDFDVHTARSSGVNAIREPREDELASVPRVVASQEEIASWPLGGGCAAVMSAIDGKMPLRSVFRRARVSPVEGMSYVATLLELGLVAVG